jgi:hypothetical protein
VKPCSYGKKVSLTTGECVGRDGKGKERKACSPGKMRDPYSNRCVSGKRKAGSGKKAAGSGKKAAGSGKKAAGSGKKAAGSGKKALGPCPAGKTRNPDTNRCKKDPKKATGSGKKAAGSGKKALGPCPAGKTRNPDTNRCKKDPKPLSKCKDGYEKSPKGRCRKIKSASKRRSPSTYNAFVAAKTKELKASNPGMTPNERMKAIAKAWQDQKRPARDDNYIEELD